MGKRKLLGTTFYHCDYSGFPMRAQHCFMPDWNENGRLHRKGSYSNWESVVAHLDHLEVAAEKKQKVLDFIENITGTIVTPAPPLTELAHCGGALRDVDFHAKCTRQVHPITAVKIAPNGEVFEVILHPDPSSTDSGRFDFAAYLHKPFPYHGGPSTFHSMRKKTKGTERDLSVWYYPCKDLPHNPVATSTFKMQLYGDVLLVQQSREESFITRERYVSFTKQTYQQQFVKRRRKPVTETASLSTDEYTVLKKDMQEQLNQFEASGASDAVPPTQLSAVTRLPTSSHLGKSVLERAAPL